MRWLALVLLLCSPTRADGWYGWQTAAVDAAAATITTFAIARPSLEAFVVGASALVLGAPIIDLAHGQLVKGTISFTARVFATIFITDAFLQYLSFDGCPPLTRPTDDELVLMSVNGGFIVVTAVLDAALGRVAVAPVVAPGPQHTMIFGVAARF
jgi:hypothetical protein